MSMSELSLKRPRAGGLIGAALLAACALAGSAAHADDLQREQLARIAVELQNVQAMVEQARQSAQSSEPAERVRFRYDWLERDLELMRSGIEQHLDAPRQPRPVAPLRGDYRY